MMYHVVDNHQLAIQMHVVPKFKKFYNLSVESILVSSSYINISNTECLDDAFYSALSVAIPLPTVRPTPNQMTVPVTH